MGSATSPLLLVEEEKTYPTGEMMFLNPIETPPAGSPTNPSGPMRGDPSLCVGVAEGPGPGTTTPSQRVPLPDPVGGVWLSNSTAEFGVGQVNFNFKIEDVNALLPKGAKGSFKARSVYVSLQVGSGSMPDLSQEEVYCDVIEVDPPEGESPVAARLATSGSASIRVHSRVALTWSLLVDVHGQYTTIDGNGHPWVAPGRLAVRFNPPVTVQPQPTGA